MKSTTRPHLEERLSVQDRNGLERQTDNCSGTPKMLGVDSDRPKQWLWFISLWCGGLVSTALLAYSIRWFLFR